MPNPTLAMTATSCPCGGCKKSRDPREAAGWHDRQGPGPLLRQRHHKEAVELPARWVDHHYRLNQADGSWIYVAEPYDLSDGTVADLAWLSAEHGYRVTVTAHAARHDPGATLAVTLEP